MILLASASKGFTEHPGLFPSLRTTGKGFKHSPHSSVRYIMLDDPARKLSLRVLASRKLMGRDFASECVQHPYNVGKVAVGLGHDIAPHGARRELRVSQRNCGN